MEEDRRSDATGDEFLATVEIAARHAVPRRREPDILAWFSAVLPAWELGAGPTSAVSATCLILYFATSFVALASFERAPSLSHPTRRRIRDHLVLLPGDHLRSIARALRLGLSTTKYHLGVLLSLGLVRVEKVNGRSRYYAAGRESQHLRNQLFARHWKYRDLRLRVLSAVRRLDRPTPAAVAHALGISRQLAAYHLGCLVETGLVCRAPGRYWISNSTSTREEAGRVAGP